MKDNTYTQTDPLIYKNKIHFLPCKLYLYQNKYKMLLELKFNVIVIFSHCVVLLIPSAVTKVSTK